MRTVGRIAGLCLAAGVWLASAGGAWAQEQDGDAAYQGLLEEAVSEYNAGRYAEARALFRQAHETEPSARTLRGLGMAAFELREYVDALRALEAALASEERPLTDEQREHVEGLIQRSNTFVGRYRITLAPEDARLYVDDAPAQRGEDGTVLLNLGRHTLEARCPDCRTERRSVRVRGGENEEIAFELERETDEEPAEDSVVVADPVEEPAPASPPPRDHAGTGMVLIIGAGVLAAGAAAGVLWWLDRSDELDRCEQAGAACRNEETLSLERGTAAVVTIGLGVVAAGALVGGLVLLGGEEESDVALGCVPGPMGVSCAGRF